MADYRGRIPRIRWGTSYVNAFDADAFENARAFSEPREGSEWAIGSSGAEDVWIVGTDHFLEGDLRWIPTNDVLIPVRATGWNGSAGGRAMLEWLRSKNTGKFHPDNRNLVVSPAMSSGVGTVTDFTSTPGAGITLSVDGVELAQKMVGAAVGSGVFALVSQIVYGFMPGEAVAFSVEYKAASLSSMIGEILIDYLNSGGGTISSVTTSNLTSTSYNRASLTGTTPSLCTAIRVNVKFLATGAGGSGTIYFRNAMLERKSSASSTWVDNPSYDLSLMDPMKGGPELEPNGKKRLRVKFRNTAAVLIDGY